MVVTLKEMNGVNRIEDFKRLCMARGWLVNELNVQNQLDIYVRAEEEIELEWFCRNDGIIVWVNIWRSILLIKHVILQSN